MPHELNAASFAIGKLLDPNLELKGWLYKAKLWLLITTTAMTLLDQPMCGQFIM